MKPELPKLAHEEVDARTRGARHLRQGFLIHPAKCAVRPPGFPITSEQQQRACKPFLTRVEELVNEVFFDTDVPRQHAWGRKRSANAGFACSCRIISCFSTAMIVQGGSLSRRHSPRLTRETPFTEEVAILEHSDYGFSSGTGQDRQPHGPFLDIHDTRGRIALSKDPRLRLVVDALAPSACRCDSGGRFDRCGPVRMAHWSSPRHRIGPSGSCAETEHVASLRAGLAAAPLSPGFTAQAGASRMT